VGRVGSSSFDQARVETQNRKGTTVTSPNETNALTRDVSVEVAAETAYANDEAVVYDEKRLTTPAAKLIHEFERDLLFRAISQAVRGGRFLEIGCGTGRLLIEAVQRGHRVDGADASGAMLEQLKAKLSDSAQIEVFISDAAQVPQPDESYDLVYSIRLLNQTESPEYALKVVEEMCRLARPGGLIFVEFVNEFRPRWGAARGNNKTTRLRPAQVRRRGVANRAEVLQYAGAFFLSMQAYHACPVFLLPLLKIADRSLSWLFPRLCARSYVLFRKNIEQSK